MGAFKMVVFLTQESFSTEQWIHWIYCTIMAQVLLQLLALCLDLIFRFVPSNGFANEEVRDEDHPQEHEGSRHEYSVS